MRRGLVGLQSDMVDFAPGAATWRSRPNNVVWRPTSADTWQIRSNFCVVFDSALDVEAMRQWPDVNPPWNPLEPHFPSTLYIIWTLLPINSNPPVIPLIHGGGVMVRLLSTVHESAVVFQQMIDVVKHDTVHGGEPLDSLHEPDVHHCSLVEHRRRVLQRHNITSALQCRSVAILLFSVVFRSFLLCNVVYGAGWVRILNLVVDAEPTKTATTSRATVHDAHSGNQHLFSAGTGASWAGAWMQTALVLAIEDPWVVGSRFWGHTQQNYVGQ